MPEPQKAPPPDRIRQAPGPTRPRERAGDEDHAWYLRNGLVICDERGAIAYVDHSAEHLIGVDGGLILGRALDEVIKPIGEDGTEQAWSTAQTARDTRGRARGAPAPPISCRVNGGRALICEPFRIDSILGLVLIGQIDGADPSRRLAYLASHDALTGLPNRAAIRERLGMLHDAAGIGVQPYSVLLLDLDHFKIVNDRFGHASGDQVLSEIARHIPAQLRDIDRVGRWGGEEFLCLLPRVDGRQAQDVAERIRAEIAAAPVAHEERRIRITTSIGVASYPRDGAEPDALLAKADQALYEAKRAGRNRIRTPQGHRGNVFALADLIEQALADGRLVPGFEPIVDLTSGEPRGEQASARILLPHDATMQTEQFRPAAEQLSLIHRVDHRVIRLAIERCAERAIEQSVTPSMLVDFSADFLRHPELVEDVLGLIHRQCERCADLLGEVKPLVVEISHRHLMQDIHEAKQILAPFVDLGLRLAVDDFAHGHASLSYLIELPIELIKIEPSLTRRARREQRALEMLQGIQSLAGDLGVITIAEGVDDAETFEMAQNLGIDWGQGRYFSASHGSAEPTEAPV